MKVCRYHDSEVGKNITEMAYKHYALIDDEFIRVDEHEFTNMQLESISGTSRYINNFSFFVVDKRISSSV